MLPVILEAAVRSALLLVVVLLALKALRVRNPHVLMAAWQMVLAASLLMPLPVALATLAVVPPGLPMPELLATEFAALAASAPPQVLSEIESAAMAVDWLAIGSWLYLLVAALLLARLLFGCALMWRLCRAASAVHEGWTAGCDVRMHPSITVPLTFGSTILLPPGHSSWDATQRRAVLAHEDAHVRRADFYVLALASINRAMFWFNPLAWWLHGRIADLAEARSDAAAIEDIEDRVRYAEILLDFGSRASRSVISLAMARAKTVRRRVEQILGETMMPKKMDWKAWAVLVAGILPLAVIAAGAVVAQAPLKDQQATVSQLDLDIVARRRAEQRMRRTEVYIDPKILDNYTGYYQLAQFSIATVTRLGDRLHVQVTGQEFLPVYPESTRKFFYKAVRAQISFVTDSQGRATGLVLHQGGLDRPAKRIEEAQAKAAEQSLARRIKEATPQTGSEAALTRQIFAFQQGQPAYHEMTDALAAVTRPQVPRIERRFASLGPLQSVSFRGVGNQGFDVYEAKFENGISICRIFLTEDGKVSGLLFQWGP